MNQVEDTEVNVDVQHPSRPPSPPNHVRDEESERQHPDPSPIPPNFLIMLEGPRGDQAEDTGMIRSNTPSEAQPDETTQTRPFETPPPNDDRSYIRNSLNGPWIPTSPPEDEEVLPDVPPDSQASLDHIASKVSMPVPQPHYQGIDDPLSGAKDTWGTIFERVMAQDTAMVEAYTTDIDGLLIFAGLFSAVLTTFISQVYPQLQQDNTQLSAQILGDISRQLQNISTNQAATATSAPSSSAPFTPSRTFIIVNALWLMSLLSALAPVLLGLFVKQWLREYITWTRISPHDVALHRREYRHDAFQKWQVGNIATALPALLQLSLVLFFAGLIVLLKSLSDTLMIVVSAAVGAIMFCVVAVLVLPAFRKDCPYRSPLAWTLVRVAIALQSSFRSIASWRKSPKAKDESEPQKDDSEGQTKGGPQNETNAIAGTGSGAGTGPVSRSENRAASHAHPSGPGSGTRNDADVEKQSPHSSKDRWRRLRFWFQSRDRLYKFETKPKDWIHRIKTKFLARLNGEPKIVVANHAPLPGTIGHSTGSTSTELKIHIRPKGLGHTWDRRDSEVPSMQGVVYDVAWKCRTLLWVASHENFSETFLVRCINELSSFQYILDKQEVKKNSLFEGEDSPYRRLCASWLAIAGHLGYKTSGSLELNDHMWEIFHYGIRQDWRYGQLSQLPEALKIVNKQVSAIDPRERATMFHLLCHDIEAALDHGVPPDLPTKASPFSEDNLQCLYAVSLCFLRMLCHRRSNLHTKYVRLLLRVSMNHEALLWPKDDKHHYGPQVCLSLLDDVLIAVETIRCEVDDFLAILKLATEWFTVVEKRLEEKTISHSFWAGPPWHYWSIVNAAVSMELSTAQHTERARVQKAVRQLLEKVQKLMEDELARPTYSIPHHFEPKFGPSNPFMPRFILFCGRHKDAIPSKLPSILDECIARDLINLFKPEYEDFMAQHIARDDWARKQRRRFIWKNGLLPKRVKKEEDEAPRVAMPEPEANSGQDATSEPAAVAEPAMTPGQAAIAEPAVVPDPNPALPWQATMLEPVVTPGSMAMPIPGPAATPGPEATSGYQCSGKQQFLIQQLSPGLESPGQQRSPGKQWT
ncbi:hypothetical protein PUNSTDRAFT_143031 [Punctularia strigosozonata HHB-11173 SS5]|uniref:uncharacterized protein n=1 Tax=Punctularia strigosozonata (strain HHB-11173) TaxID=741275 RepID=UPI0004416D82|nr:uncharacterized protein PUNSTDRAFT_143031 [Punctularia strigosozonata HHB-11173 SS5]EIN09475.1 hypothetical protein PUNSTDRAFT_143031 [Punctularia strigosozonata HHB-11173 SS5]